MTTKLDEIAKTLWENGEYWRLDWNELHEPTREGCREQARAVLRKHIEPMIAEQCAEAIFEDFCRRGGTSADITPDLEESWLAIGRERASHTIANLTDPGKGTVEGE